MVIVERLIRFWSVDGAGKVAKEKMVDTTNRQVNK